MFIKEKYKYHSKSQLKEELISSCKKGDLTLTKVLLDNTELKLYSFFDYLGDAIIAASRNGHLDILKHLNSLLDNNEKKGMEPYYNTALTAACRDGNIEIVKYFLSSKELEGFVDIHTEDDNPIDWACSMGHLDIVEYLTTSTDIKERVDVNKSPNAFIIASANGKFDIIRYFIFDLNMKKSHHVQLFLKDNPNDEIDNMFSLRELNESLKGSLIENKMSEKKNKL
jgi:ankyrin repeat protein